MSSESKNQFLPSLRFLLPQIIKTLRIVDVPAQYANT